MHSFAAINPARLVIAATHSGAGKTSVTTALLAAFGKMGVGVQPFKVGPDYIDPAFHTHVTKRPSRNLDAWLLDEETVRFLFCRHAPLEGLSLIEGVMGLFDGKASSHEGSTAHVAELLAAPVVLVVNAKGMSRSAAAMVKGYASFQPGVTVAGVICNGVKSERQYALLRESIERDAGVPCFGYLPEHSGFTLQSRHLGLVPSSEVANIDAVVAALGEAALRTIDCEGLLDLAGAAPALSPGAQPTLCGRAVPGPVRLAVARDNAFSFYYEDNFDLLRELGAELVFFSPLHDAALPENTHGIYLGGGFPEVFAAKLAANVAMRSAVRESAGKGMPIYAECGGMAYLCASLIDGDGAEHAMAGVFPERVEMTARLQKFGYAEAEFVCDTPLGVKGARVRVHEFHYSRIVPGQGDGCLLLRKDGAEPWHGGRMTGSVLAAYPHVHFYSNPELAVRFLDQCAVFRERQNV